jgi:hypothetical protein
MDAPEEKQENQEITRIPKGDQVDLEETKEDRRKSNDDQGGESTVSDTAPENIEKGEEGVQQKPTSAISSTAGIVAAEVETAFVEYLTSNPRASTQDLAKRFRLNAVQISLLKKKHFPETFAPTNVLGPENQGERAARVFQEFEKGKKPHQVVISLKLAPGEISSFWVEYQDLKKRGMQAIEEPEILYPCSVCSEDMCWDFADSRDCEDLYELLENGGIDRRSCIGCGGTMELLESWRKRHSQTTS